MCRHRELYKKHHHSSYRRALAWISHRAHFVRQNPTCNERKYSSALMFASWQRFSFCNKATWIITKHLEMQGRVGCCFCLFSKHVVLVLIFVITSKFLPAFIIIFHFSFETYRLKFQCICHTCVHGTTQAHCSGQNQIELIAVIQPWKVWKLKFSGFWESRRLECVFVVVTNEINNVENRNSLNL